MTAGPDTVTEHARAKINLTLSVLGRRGDGYHELLSLVAFADTADRLSIDPAGPPGLVVNGPFGAAIDGPNLVTAALELIVTVAPSLSIGEVTLVKSIPVAAGLGGGSSDAAALLRAVRAAYPAASGLDWMALARRLGSDVPVCFENRATWMSGAGENLHGLGQPLPRLNAVLVNPRADVPHDKTARVFRALAATALAVSSDGTATALPAIPDRAELLALMRRAGNDLEAPATAVVPQIAEVLDALEACSGVEIARLSGAGPTCFAIFADAAAAAAAATALTTAHPDWWIKQAVIG